MCHVCKPGYGSLPRELLELFPQVLKFGVVHKNIYRHQRHQAAWLYIICVCGLKSMYIRRVVADSAYFMTYEEITNCANTKSAKMANPLYSISKRYMSCHFIE